MITFVSGSKSITVNQDVLLTKQVASFFTFSIKGDFSINFKIPNDSVNRNALGIYHITQTENLRQEWEMYSDINKIGKGELVVQKISNDFIELFFISGNANWISRLIENTTDLDLIRYGRPWNELAVTERGRDYGIVYPLCDWAYSFQKATATFLTVPAVDSSGAKFVDFYPCFYYKDLLKEIIQQSGFKLAGDILQDVKFNKLIITPASAEIKRNEVFVNKRKLIAYKTTAQNVGSVDTYAKVTFEDATNPTTLFSSNTYTSDTNYFAYVKCYFNVSVDQDYTVNLYVDGVPNITGIQTFSGVEGFCEWSEEMIKGRTIEVYIKCNAGGTAFNVNENSSVEIAPEEVVIPRTVGNETVYPNDFIQLKSIDVVKFVAVYFGCYIYFDEYSKTININRIDKMTDTVDWSEYFKGYEATYDAKQAINNYIRLADPTDENIILYNSRNETGFGEGNLISDTDLNTENELYKAPFASSESRITVKYGNLMLPYVGLIKLEDLDEFSEYTSVTDQSGIAQFNGVGFNLSGSEVVRVVDASGLYSGYHVSNGASYNVLTSNGMGYKGDSSGVFYKQRANFIGNANRILLYKPDVNLSELGGGDTGGPGIQRHALELDTTIASGSPVYNAQFDNSSYSRTLTTTGTEIDLGQLIFLDNVTVFVSRVGNAADIVDISYYRNGILEASESPILAGNPVNVNYTFTGTVASDDFKVVITEG